MNLDSSLRPRRACAPGCSFVITLLAFSASACATAGAGAPGPAGPPPEGKAAVEFAPEEVQVSPLDLELSEKNDEELFAVGMAAYGARDWPRAASAFARIADRYPGTRHEATALFNAGLAYQRMGAWRLAMERFQALVRGWEGPDALEAAFKVAECHYHLDDLTAARATLTAVLGRPELPAAARIRALAQVGVIELEGGQPEEAERSLRRALAAWSAVGDTERLDPYYAAQAEYYLGEVYRGHFLAVTIDPARDGEARLQEAMEQKSSLLLTAQGHYLRAIRHGDHDWAVASGTRVGELYDAFRQQLLEAPLPPELGPEEQQAYRVELRRKVRVLAAKAITAYEATLDRATAGGVTDEDVKILADAREALRRLEDALREDAGGM